MKPGIYARNYWKIGFRSKLYDLLTPEAYRASIRACAAKIPAGDKLIVLDAGCGSGQLLTALKDRLQAGLRLIGVDRLPEGLTGVCAKAAEWGISSHVLAVPADLTRPLPLRDDSVDAVVAHFSVYAIPGGGEKRRQALEILHRVLKPGGTLIFANPSQEYSSRTILAESVRMLQESQNRRAARIAKYVIHPFTHHLGLKYIERQIRQDAMHGYSEQEIQEEVESAGFTVESVEPTYARSGWLVVARKLKNK